MLFLSLAFVFLFTLCTDTDCMENRAMALLNNAKILIIDKKVIR